MPPPIAVQLEHISKTYPLFCRRRDRLFYLLGWPSRFSQKKVLKNVTLTVLKGEALGIIGENGSGKTTLLKIVAGITEPDTGFVCVSHPVSAILELGLGFHPDLTGRENALLYGSIMGVPKGEMELRLDEVSKFADVREFFDQPLRTYSSGMAARLAFAVATTVKPEVLVVDEALAVGDAAFQKKCVDRMRALKLAGTTILFCSHSPYLVTSFCERAIWLRDGRIEAEGPADQVVEAYSEFLEKERATREKLLGGRFVGLSTLPTRPRLRALLLEPAPTEWVSGNPLVFHLDLEVPPGSSAFHVGVSVDTLDERCVFFTSTHWKNLPALKLLGSVRVSCYVDNLPLGYGKFWLNGFVFDETGLVLWDYIRLPRPLEVQGQRWNPALLQVPHSWSCG